MSPTEYITHFSMWAALKSPLIIGTDIRPSHITPTTLRILSNPAVLAVSQDPLGQAAFRRWRFSVPDVDAYGQGEIQMWSGALWGGDMLVVLLNGGTQKREMNATLVDVFWGNGPGGTAREVRQRWDVYDLWAGAMDEETAKGIIDAAASGEGGEETIGAELRYNATENGGYLKGLEQGLEVLMGKKVGTVEPNGMLLVAVNPHGVGMFRLRLNQDDSHDEL
jgi:alpha-galactosidase